MSTLGTLTLDLITTTGGMSYSRQIEIAQRWQNAVDYGSPMSAWTKIMFEVLEAVGGDKVKANKLHNGYKWLKRHSVEVLAVTGNGFCVRDIASSPLAINIWIPCDLEVMRDWMNY